MAIAWGLLGLVPTFLGAYFLLFPQLEFSYGSLVGTPVSQIPGYDWGWFVVLLYGAAWVGVSAGVYANLPDWISWVHHRYFRYAQEHIFVWAFFAVIFSTLLGVFLSLAYRRLEEGARPMPYRLTA